ncbi:type II secretion system secretin GspD [Thermodesulfobacteriota bacterium]
MKFINYRFKGMLRMIACAAMLLTATQALAQSVRGPDGKKAPPPRDRSARSSGVPKQFVSIDFNNVDITVFIKFISELTGTNFIIDQRVKGKVTIISPAKISVAEAYKVFESVLEVNGYTTVTAGEITKIVPSPDARSKNIETLLKEEARSPEDRVVTQIIPLAYADPNEIKRLFAPLISKSSVLLAYPPTNMMIVTDVYSNIKRLLRILKAIDISGIGLELSVIPLENGDAAKLVSLLTAVFRQSKKPKKGVVVQDMKFVADERTNTVVLLASEDETVRVRKLIALLDKEIPKGKEKIKVYYLEHATAEDLAKVLLAIPTQSKKPTKGKKAAPVVSEQVQITADKSTNSLIIMAEKDDYLVLEEVIKKLDIPRAMVYIEALIIEVNVDKDFRLGTEWTAGGKTDIGSKQGAFGGGYTGAGEGNIAGILGGATGVSQLPPGFSMGVFAETLKIGDVQFPSLAAVVQAFKKDKDVHILSTPQILTTDNEEASITVGKNVPFQTRSAAESGTDTYSSYEYKDVGITLKITPQISKDRMVRLKISQLVTKLDELGTVSSDRPTTLKRTIDTTVIVKDKNTVVIGGLIDDSVTETDYRVPCLGDIPIFGWIARSTSKSAEKTNLYVFLTPRVVQDSKEARAIYENKKKQIDAVEEGKIKMYKGKPKK